MAFSRSCRLYHILLVAQLLSPSAAAQTQTDRFSNGTCTWSGFPIPLEQATCPPPINELTAFRTGSWSPWSHRPDCSTLMDDYSPQYCLFTDDTFRGEHGISVLTTAEIAASLTGALDDTLVPPPLRSFQVDAMDRVPYKVIDIPGRGKGVIATRRIKALETIVVGYPAILTINDIEGASYEEIMGLLQKAVDQLPTQQRNEVYALAQSNGEQLPVLDIIWTNSFVLELGGARHMGVFPRSSVCLMPSTLFT